MKLSESTHVMPPPKILIYGPYGSGKTALAMSAGHLAEYIELDEGGGRTGLTLKDKLYDLRRSVEYTPITTTNYTIPNRLTQFKTRLFKILDECRLKTYKPKILIIDSFTSMCTAALNETQRNAGKLVDAASLHKALTMPEWGIAVGAVEQCLYILRSLPICVIMIAHEATIADTDGTPITRILGIGQKLPDFVPLNFDEVWYTRVSAINENVSYSLQTTPTSSKMARTRSNIGTKYDMKEGILPIFKALGWDPEAVVADAKPSDAKPSDTPAPAVSAGTASVFTK